MKLTKAIKIFLCLLHSRQWYIISEDKNGETHLVNSNINAGQLVAQVNKDIDAAVNGEILLQQAKDILS